MRNAFIKTVNQIAKHKKDLLILSGDLGYTVFEQFTTDYPQQFLNLGVSEANMIGVASGLAREGKSVLVYSIIPFITLRCFEQIRNDICAHDLNVKIIGVGSGLGYAHLGVSHHAAEDIAIMRTLPNMTVLVPADAYEVEATVSWALKNKGPVYIRLGKIGEPLVHTQKISFKSNSGGYVIKEGKKILIFSSGTIVANVLKAVTLLERQGIFPCVVCIPVIKPLNKKWIQEYSKNFSYIITVEEHSVIGGLGSAIAETLMECNVRLNGFKRLGFNDEFCRVIGSYDYMRNHMGLSPEKIADEILITYQNHTPESAFSSKLRFSNS